MKEQELEIIDKWDFLLENFKSNIKKSKFARILEKTVKNDPKNSKVLIPIACRVFNSLKDIKMSNGHQNKIELGEYYKQDFFINNSLIVEQMTQYCSFMSSKVIEQYKKVNKLGYLQIINDNGIDKIYYIF